MLSRQVLAWLFLLWMVVGWGRGVSALPGAAWQAPGESTPALAGSAPPAAEPWADIPWATLVERRLQDCGEHRAELEQALAAASPAELKPLQFLIAYFPQRDVGIVRGADLLENVRWALKVRAATPWQQAIPEEIFFNDVLPYANLDEPRDPWRAEFHERFWPLVAQAQSATEAAQILNAQAFQILNVKYSTGRKRANQSPRESIEQGVASCSGLSIILVNACRAVGVPARVAGIPRWANKPGNHTWVEIWDGDWHFTGACEHNPEGLNRTWFNADAAQADPEKPLNSIYAASYRPTGGYFPLVWNPRDRSFAGWNVTTRYLQNPPPRDETRTRWMIRVWDSAHRQRVAANLRIVGVSDPQTSLEGVSRDESFDTNDIASFDLARDAAYRLIVTTATGRWEFPFRTTTEPERLIELDLPAIPGTMSTEEEPSLSPADQQAVEEFARQCFAADDLAQWPKSAERLDQLLRQAPRQVREIVWRAFRQAALPQSWRGAVEANEVVWGEHRSPYTLREVGERPAQGWPLVIAMHGGGNAPPELNDSQWRVMQKYYKDHPEVTGYLYLALRAPNNTWNGFYDDYVYPLIEQLIAQLVVHAEVDPNHVVLIGYSHGGYGAFAIGPKIPHRFSAIHSSAAAPTDGETTPKTLRTTRFTFMIGERDTAYGRRERCEKFAEQIRELRQSRIDIYPVDYLYQPGFGHGGLPDRDILAQLLPYQRQPVPAEISWELTDTVNRDLFWLTVPEPREQQSVEARWLAPNQLQIDTKGVPRLHVGLDERMINWEQPVVLKVNGQTHTITATPQLRVLCESVWQRRDIHLAHSYRHEMSGLESAAPESSR